MFIHFYFPYLAPPNLQLSLFGEGMRNAGVMNIKAYKAKKSVKGFSAVELLVVLAIIAVMSAISIPYLLNYKKGYRSEDQTLKMIDVMRETAQLALQKRRTFRFEIDLTDNEINIIDENGTAADVRIKNIPLEMTKEVRVDMIPVGVTKPNPPNYTDITFAVDSLGHLEGSTTVTGHSVWAARFRSDGSVVNAANNPISANIYVWPPQTPGSTTPRNKTEVRAITVFGGSGAIRYWKHNGVGLVADQ